LRREKRSEKLASVVGSRLSDVHEKKGIKQGVPQKNVLEK
jgi:hypothetical protein